MNYRLINIVSGVVAAGIAVGCVTAYTCGSAKEIDLQSPALLGDEAVSFEDLFYGQDLQAEETAYIPMSMGNFDINDYTIIAVSSYSDIASELGKMMFAPITMLGCMATATGCFTRDSFEKSLYEILPERKHNLIPINMEAFDRGAAFAK